MKDYQWADSTRMADIIPLLGLPSPPHGRSSYYVPCPCCDSGHKKHLNINLSKDVFRCPRCGFSGGMFDLYGYYTGVRRENVLEDMRKRLGNVNIGKHSDSANACAAGQPPDLYAHADNPPTDVETRDATYRALLGMLSLASDHTDNLLQRGLTREVIAQNGYRTTPVAGVKALARKLMAEGHYLAGVPGFFRDENDGAWTFTHNMRGILIPVRDHKGRVQGLQIRRDNVEKRKFRWVSSADMPDGCRAEGWVHIAGPVRENMLLTEGPMKADVIHYLTGHTVIAVPGVHSLTRLESLLPELMAEGAKHIMTAFDMDFLASHHVQRGYSELVWMLHDRGLTFGTYVWHPEYKGLDDYVWQCLKQGQHAV